LLLGTNAIAAEVPYSARIVDGDGLKIGHWEIRLFGIDAPEMRGGPEGRRSHAALEDLISGRPVDCAGLNFDRYGRVVAICKVDGKDIGLRMLVECRRMR
jgi:endonuclease YncB( thermonuclease family)